MISIKLTENQFEALQCLIEYIVETEYDYHNERLESGEDVSGDIYSLAMELYSVNWEAMPS